MEGGKYKKAMLLGLAALLLLVSNFSQHRLNNERRVLGLVWTDDPLDNAPPVLAFTTVALGGFRGLIANVLWIRANDLQQDSKYFEMVQLADWITKLQPHFTTVWTHQAWNMAYNISIKFPDKEDRWRWVKRGIELLRDQAIPLNPHEPLLYRELAWFFEHKIGDNMDDAHMFYKLSWAHDFEQVVGDPPYNFDSLINPTTDEARERLRRLKEVYKMDPKVMKEADARYGPLDWRLPEAHAIYWAVKGLESARSEDLMPLRRVIYQSMQLAFQRGRLVINKYDGHAELCPNVDIVQKVSDSYDEMIKVEPDVENIKQGHQNFLKAAVTELFLYNREAEARHWWNILRERYPRESGYFASMETFVVDRVEDIVQNDGRDKVLATIEGYLTRSYYYQAIGEEDQAIGYEKFAAQFYRAYQKKNTVQGKADINARLTLGSYRSMKQRVLDRMLDPNTRQMSPVLAAQLRTALGLPAASETPGTTAGGMKEMPRTPGATAAKPKDAATFLADNAKLPGVITTSSGLQYKVLHRGEGDKPKADDTVLVNYRGTLIDGTEFDSSYRRNQPLSISLKNVIAGWKEAIPMMPIGSKWQVVIPPALGYGSRGMGDKIGPNEVLIFEIELLGTN